MESVEQKIITRSERSGEAAIVTGASSGIGAAISRRLCGLGYEVFGFARHFESEAETEVFDGAEQFHPIVCDVLDTEHLCACVKQIASEHLVRILVNNAGVGYYGLHEELNPAKIKELVRTNLETPMILTQQLLRQFKKNAGIIINISSVTADESNPHGCAYGATKAGLASFSHSLFDETRKYGVKVVTISPDMTKTNLYRNADFQEGEESASYLLPEEIADAVEFVLGQREGLVVSDLKLKPQLHRIRRKQKVTNAKNKDEA
ncbi:MAG: SDR family oxidoreductase [Lachnospiraceae bacterium]|nr:SDR family oxidoreductase [Lachnospiraceae bacterium]